MANHTDTPIAFCLTGRSNGLAAAAPSIASHVIKPLGGGTVVLVTEARPDRNEIKSAKALLHAVAVLEEEFPSPQPAVCDPPQRSDAGSGYHQWKKLGLCTTKLQHIEKKQDIPFAYVVRLRTDLVWRTPVSGPEGFLYPDAVGVLGSIHRRGVNDYVFSAPRRFVDDAFGTLHRAFGTCFTPAEQTCGLTRTDRAGTRVAFLGSECLVKHWFNRSGVPVVSMAQFIGRNRKPFTKSAVPPMALHARAAGWSTRLQRDAGRGGRQARGRVHDAPI